MKLSNDTREVLKNYSTINSNLLVSSGNQIATMSQMKNIVSKQLYQIPLKQNLQYMT